MLVERAEEEAVAPAMAVAAIADLVEIGVERSGRDLVQQRLPDMGAVAFDQDDVVALAADISRRACATSSSPAAPPPTMTIWVFLPVIVQQDENAPALRTGAPIGRPAWTAGRTASNVRCGPSFSVQPIKVF